MNYHPDKTLEPKLKKISSVDIDHSFSVRDIFNVLFCHKWKIMLFVTTLVSTVSLATYRMPYVYESNAEILIGVGRDPNSIAPILGPSQDMGQDQIQRVNNELVVLKSRNLTERVVEKLGPKLILKRPKPNASVTVVKPIEPAKDKAAKIEKTPAQLEQEKQEYQEIKIAAVNVMNASLSVEAKPLSFMVGLRLTSRDPEVAQKALSTLIDEYIARYIELSEPKSVKIFQERYDRNMITLHKKEEILAKFRQENNIYAIEVQKGMLISREGELIGRFQTNLSEISGLEAKIAQLSKTVKKYPSRITQQEVLGRTNYVADGLKNTLTRLKTEEVELRSRYQDNSRRIIENNEQISIIEASLANEPDSKIETATDINTIYQDLTKDLEFSKADLLSKKAVSATLKEELKKIQEELSKLTSGELTLERMQRDVKLAELELQENREILQRAASFNALNEGKITSVEIIEPATLSYEHVSPNKPRNIILALFMGILGGIGLAFFLDYFDDSMKTNEDVKRRLHLPVLAIISNREYEKCV